MKTGLTKIQDSAVHERGVFAAKDFEKEETIEECSYILLDSWKLVPPLKKYCHLVIEDGKPFPALVSGHGMFYNHSFNPNVTRSYCVQTRTFTFKAAKPIQQGEELFIDYGKKYQYKKFINGGPE
jgi:hypothetical protein